MNSNDTPNPDESPTEYAERMRALKEEQDRKVHERRTKRGVVIVNTGDGKGKSTAGFGTAIRAAGHGQRVALFQFIKGEWKTGEREAFKRFPEIDYFQSGNGFTWNTQDRDKDVASARAGWAQVLAAIDECRGPSPKYQLLVLDELNVVRHFNFLPAEEVASALRNKPEALSVVVTGRDAPAEIIELADTVTEMRPIKHAFDAGIQAIKGIEF